MKRLRLDRWTSHLLAARPSGAPVCTSMAPGASASVSVSLRSRSSPARYQSTAAPAASAPSSTTPNPDKLINVPEDPEFYEGLNLERFPPLEKLPPKVTKLPSPHPDRALKSAKLAALHARLSLPQKLPLQTLARALVDASADENPLFNNTNLAFVGQTIINYHVAEMLMVRYPRLPMNILYAAMKGYAGPTALHHVARSWGIEHTTAPGGEVDPGLLQFSLHNPGKALVTFGYRRAELEGVKKYKWRHGLSSRVVFDDDFGELVDDQEDAERKAAELKQRSDTEYGNAYTRELAERAYANACRAIVGAVYAHCGREPVKAFVKAHILSRTLDLEKLFAFHVPTRELSMLCAREDFEPPVARLLSETGRLSRTPVFVVGIFSGKDKLGEGAASSLEHARTKAAINALKAWYLYSPGEHVRVPSDMLAEDARPWEPVYIDIGEVVAR
ncbi:mitochondrial 54S ribosomal protein mL44 [Thermochaetoides thermophila DSM 1495]|uniref:Large ribosomal subunit protein mL44 n=1 Tax=Chaetomium thermophilum (strain DSM 1495 / CBS 144.50 / IMI 039719) TaxID=759272 RepID=G0S570_CHATD|nr:60S ribosomal protein L3-like protein [Thermochaetoides thermophila DSM 1495]EGS21389.1 60S ribosomal protein L3-like protein [Thermochaetoides thermophila DSM 1495]